MTQENKTPSIGEVTEHLKDLKELKKSFDHILEEIALQQNHANSYKEFVPTDRLCKSISSEAVDDYGCAEEDFGLFKEAFKLLNCDESLWSNFQCSD